MGLTMTRLLIILCLLLSPAISYGKQTTLEILTSKGPISIVLFVMMMFAMNSQAATIVPKVDKIDPPCWFTQMKDPSLQLMVYGKDIASSDVHLNYPGVSIQSIVKLESPNYLLVYLTITDEAKPGTLQLVFTNGTQKLVQPYELKARKRDALDRKGFSMSDVLYLLMPDRFADGDESNDQITDALGKKSACIH